MKWKIVIGVMIVLAGCFKKENAPPPQVIKDSLTSHLQQRGQELYKKRQHQMQLEVYKKMLVAAPENQEIKKKIKELERLLNDQK